MKFVDDFHEKPQDAFRSTTISAWFGLSGIVGVAGDYSDGRRIHFFSAFGSAFFLIGAAALCLRGFQMRREQKEKAP